MSALASAADKSVGVTVFIPSVMLTPLRQIAAPVVASHRTSQARWRHTPALFAGHCMRRTFPALSPYVKIADPTPPKETRSTPAPAPIENCTRVPLVVSALLQVRMVIPAE